VLVLLLLIPLATAACERAAGADSAIVFGVAGPMDESYGQSTRMGAELARKQINARGGIRRRPLELRVENDHADPQRAIAVAEALANDPRVLAVAGHVNSGATRAAAQSYDGRLAAVATSATSPLISQLGPWIFRIASSDSVNAIALARHARSISRRTAVLYANDDYGRGLATSFNAALEAAGDTALEVDPYLESTEDFTPYLRRMRGRGVELIFLAGLESAAARAIRQAQGLGLSARVIGGDGLEGLLGMGDEFEGTLVGLLFHPDASPAAREFSAAFRAEYGRDPDSFAATAYDAVMLLAKAADEGGADRTRIRNYLERVGRGVLAFEGATGSLSFDENGDPSNKQFAIGVIRDGAIRLAGGER
jgi:branched-chain amino acid transport system substrate-binding protein